VVSPLAKNNLYFCAAGFGGSVVGNSIAMKLKYLSAAVFN
jgi:hypothetical protein